jgi:hypothetical protein
MGNVVIEMDSEIVVQYQLGKSCMAARGLVVDYLEFLF